MAVSITKSVVLFTFTLLAVFGSSQAETYGISDEAFNGFKDSILENINQEGLTCYNYFNYCTQANIPKRTSDLCLETYRGFLCGTFNSDADIKAVMQKFFEP